MKFYTYLVAWDEVHFNSVEIEESFKKYNSPITVINSGNMKRDHWDNVGDIRYYRQFYHALKSFDSSYDYMSFMCGDISFDNWSNIISRAEYILSTYNNTALYAPHLTNEPWSENSSKISDIDNEINIAIQTDGIYVFIHRDIVAVLLEYFNYLDKSIDLATMKSGWGLDMIWSSIAIVNNKPILRDKLYIPTHPAGSSYDHGRATEEMNIMISEFHAYLDSKGIDSSPYKDINQKIYGRMQHLDDCKDINDFYSNFNLYQPIKYHVIHINDERKSNRNVIDSLINGEKLSIFSLNASDPLQVDKFSYNFPNFKKAWDGFKAGEFGNFASHYAAWNYVIDNDLDSLLIFEDDAIMHSDFINKYNIIMNNVPNDYDVVSIYVDPNQYDRFRPDHLINDYIAKGYQDWSTLCYVISRQGARKLIEYVNNVGMDHPTDWFIFRKGHSGIFNVYTVPPQFPSPLAIDHSYPSQVQ